jgi:hypothetical protein
MSDIDETPEINSDYYHNHAWLLLNGIEVLMEEPYSYDIIVVALDSIFPNMFSTSLGICEYLKNIYMDTIYTILNELSITLRRILIRAAYIYEEFEPIYMNLFEAYISRLTNFHLYFNALMLPQHSRNTSRRN